MPDLTPGIRSRRQALGISQVALAARSQLTRQSISAIEAKRSIPSVDVALRLAKALECTVEDLFGEERSTFAGGARQRSDPCSGHSSC